MPPIPAYTSTDQMADQVRAMGLKGASAFGQATALAFRYVAGQSGAANIEAFFKLLDITARDMMDYKPTMATVHNACALIVEATRARNLGLDAARAEIIRRADRYVNLSVRNVEVLGKAGANLVQDGQTIMMHSFSEGVMAVFTQARQSGKDFRVICTESRPLRESRAGVNRMTALGIPITFVLDAAMASLIGSADWCIAGADSLSIDGSAANKMGTNLLAILAWHHNVPMYIASETLKLQRATEHGHPIEMEQRPAFEVIDVEAEFTHPEQVRVRNQFFDLTPAALIRGLITEHGLIAPAQIGATWWRTEAAFEA